ncbi:MAG: SDR family oxidoreductase [Pirellulaceae bacterium]|nr:SDR family oxidoreductase [Pirellulaceae bacterium]
MSYHLLTGATGLLGTYLLRDGLSAGRRIAVVVRPSAMESARQRVESLLSRWEQELGRALPRPPVLLGNLAEPDLGLDRASLQWVRDHCVSVLHNAASLSFVANEKTGEPHRSNVEGTRNLLELCRETGIRRFHHVSTAYVCGLRSDRVMEDDLDVGQAFGNDYEETKLAAEKLVRGADFLDPPTIYRPSIIIGDSATGFTTTFHHFYTPLKIVQEFLNEFQAEKIDGTPLIAAMGLTGHERKNLVPVDWVSRVITYLYDRPEHHGRTYHLTPARRVTISECRAVLERALEEYAKQGRGKNEAFPEFEQIQEIFATQMGAYQSYWRDDPEFDRSNVLRAAPHLASCHPDFDMLLRTSRYALETNFGWPRPKPRTPDFDVAEQIENLVPITFSGNGAGNVKVGLQVNGAGGGEWTLTIDGRRPVAARPGIAPDRGDLLYLNSRTFQECVEGRLTPRRAMSAGLLSGETGALSGEQLLDVFSTIAGQLASTTPLCSTPNGTLP